MFCFKGVKPKEKVNSSSLMSTIFPVRGEAREPQIVLFSDSFVVPTIASRIFYMTNQYTHIYRFSQNTLIHVWNKSFMKYDVSCIWNTLTSCILLNRVGSSHDPLSNGSQRDVCESRLCLIPQFLASPLFIPQPWRHTTSKTRSTDTLHLPSPPSVFPIPNYKPMTPRDLPFMPVL